jgi:small conductance mechanosensitive channel
MDTTNKTTLTGHFLHYLSGHDSSVGSRLCLITLMAVLVHLAVTAIRQLSEWLVNKNHGKTHPFGFVARQPKLITFIQLLTHGITFVMYFFALGLVLEELGVNLEGYLASASIVALAISFGSQGLVQDVVISLTLIFSDAMDAGDLVEIYGATSVIGRVEEIGLRFTMVRNLYNQVVFIPNRTIANVSRFPHGGVYAYADVQLPPEVDRAKVVQIIQNIARGVWSQFGAIILQEPTIGPVQTALGAEWNFVRVHFVIWPGQGSLIETAFRQQIILAMKTFQPAYADWQVPVTYRTITAPVKV